MKGRLAQEHPSMISSCQHSRWAAIPARNHMIMMLVWWSCVPAGLLPSDAAAAAVSSNKAKQQQQPPPGKKAECIRGFTADDTAAATDHALHSTASQQQECRGSAGHAVDEARHQSSQPRRSAHVHHVDVHYVWHHLLRALL